MSLLTIDVGGPDEMTLDVDTVGHAEPREVGSRVYGFFGNERTLIQEELMVVPVALVNSPAATVRTIRRIFARGAQVVCNGDAFLNGGVNVTCSGEIVDEMEVGGTYWPATLTLYEVGSL